MADIFSRQTGIGGSFPADGVRMTFPGGINEPGMLIQRMQVSYVQQVGRIYELNSPLVYYIGGRTQGDASLSRVLGPKGLLLAFYARYGDMCRVMENTLNFTMSSAGCTPALVAGTRSTIALGGVLLRGLQIGVSAGESMVIDETSQLMFASLQR